MMKITQTIQQHPQSTHRTLQLLARNHTIAMMPEPGSCTQKIHPRKKLQSENLSEPVIPYLWVVLKSKLWGKRF